MLISTTPITPKQKKETVILYWLYIYTELDAGIKAEEERNKEESKTLHYKTKAVWEHKNWLLKQDRKGLAWDPCSPSAVLNPRVTTLWQPFISENIYITSHNISEVTVRKQRRKYPSGLRVTTT